MASKTSTNRNARANINNNNNLHSSNPLGVSKPSKMDDNTYKFMNEILKTELTKLNDNLNKFGKSYEEDVKKKAEEQKKESEKNKRLKELENTMIQLTKSLSEGKITREQFELKEIEFMDKRNEIMNKEQIEETKKQQEQMKKQQEMFKQSFEEKDAQIKEFFESTMKNVTKVVEKNSTSLRGAFLGPFNLLLSPFEKFFGGSVFSGLKNFFTRKKLTKKHPQEKDLLKNNEYTGIYIIDKLKKMIGKEKDDGLFGGIFGKIKGVGEFFKSLPLLFTTLFQLIKNIPILGKALRGMMLLIKSFGKNFLGKGGGLFKFLGSGATKAAGKAMLPLAIITSVIDVIKDGILGMFKAKEWGVGKGASALGGIFGGLDKGIKGAFKNMGKWMGIGAVIGSVVPVVGTIAGGLIGAVIGGILGFIGGERMSKAFNAIGKFFVNLFTVWIPEFFTKKVPAFFKVLLDSLKSKKKLLGNMFVNTLGFIIAPIPTLIKTFFSSGLASKVGGLLDRAIGFIFDAVSNLFGSDVTWEDAKNKISDFMDKVVIAPIKNFLSAISDFFVYASEKINENGFFKGVAEIVSGMFFKDKKTGKTDYETWKSSRTVDVNDAIIKSDGTIIRTSVDDNIIATKNIPQNLNSIRVDSNKDLNNNLGYVGMSSNASEKMDKIIDCLVQIVNKNLEVVLPSQTRSDLDFLVGSR